MSIAINMGRAPVIRLAVGQFIERNWQRSLVIRRRDPQKRFLVIARSSPDLPLGRGMGGGLRMRVGGGEKIGRCDHRTAIRGIRVRRPVRLVVGPEGSELRVDVSTTIRRESRSIVEAEGGKICWIKK